MRRFLALFSSVLLCGLCLIGSCLPVSAADEPATMLYNGVELSNIDSVWTDKETYLYALIHLGTDGFYRLRLMSIKLNMSSSMIYSPSGYSLRLYKFIDGGFTLVSDGVTTVSGNVQNNGVVWANYDVLSEDGSVYLAASDPVDPNAPAAPSGNLEVVSSQVLDDSASFVLSVSDLTDTTEAYTVKVSRYIGDTLDGEFLSDTLAGPSATLHLTAANLEPETEYCMVFMLQYNGEDTEITTETTITTLAGEGEVLPDYSGQLGEIQESLGDVQEGIGAVKDSVDGVKDSVDGVQEAVTDVKEEVASLPQKIATAILDGIKSLFIPSEEDLTQIKTEYEDMLAEKLGFIWQAFDLLTTFVGDLQSSLEDGHAYEFVFPGVKFPMQGEELVLIPETPVSLENGLMDVLRPVLGTIVSAIAVIAFVNMAHDYVLAIVSGISAYEFERRKG